MASISGGLSAGKEKAALQSRNVIQQPSQIEFRKRMFLAFEKRGVARPATPHSLDREQVELSLAVAELFNWDVQLVQQRQEEI